LSRIAQNPVAQRLFGLAKALSEATKPESKSALSSNNFNQILKGGANALSGTDSDQAGHKAGAKRHLSEQQWSQMAAQVEERGRRGFQRFVDPKNRRAQGQENYAYAVINEGGKERRNGPKAEPPMSLDEKIAQHDERWKFSPNLRRAAGVKVYGR